MTSVENMIVVSIEVMNEFIQSTDWGMDCARLNEILG